MSPVDIAAIKATLAAGNGQLSESAFDVLREISALTNSEDAEDRDVARELTIRALDVRGRFGGQYAPILDGLTRAHGLFPYMPEEGLRTEADQLAYEAFRPAGMGSVVFHRVQGTIYHKLLAGENVVLSAPTSFGKSLIIDALLASDHYANVAIVVPTLALIDETRRRLTRRFGRRFKVITHPSQAVADRNIFVYTQERVVDQNDFPKLDLFVIDEFCKLNSPEEERSGLLNQALYRLLKTGAQFYFLGPNVRQISSLLQERYEAKFYITDYSTVAIDVSQVPRFGSDLESLVELCRSLREPTLIYCQSPRQTRDVAAALVAAGLAARSEPLEAAAAWIGETYGENWLVATALRQGVGIHNGRLPRALAQFMVRSFNSGLLPFLACTSTLIEGVNTSAKNVIIYSDRIATSRFDFFTFNNIRGRSGRMFQHFIGRVFLFHPAPLQELPFVDVPALSQPENAPSSLLIQLDPADLTDRSRVRLAPLLAQSELSMETLRANKGVSPELQVNVAAEIGRRVAELHPLLAWSGYPTWAQLRETCTFAWRLSGFERMVAGVSSGPQLALKLSRLSGNPEARKFISALGEGDYRPATADERVESALEFVRQWTGHHAPRLFLSLDSIQQTVFAAAGRRPGNYRFYVSQVQNQFLPESFSALDEYGLPSEIALKIRTHLRPDRNLDILLDSVRALDVESLALTEFEKELIHDTRRSLGRSHRPAPDS